MHIDDKIKLRRGIMSFFQWLFLFLIIAGTVFVILLFGLKFEEGINVFIISFLHFLLVYAAIWYPLKFLINKGFKSVPPVSSLFSYLLLIAIFLFQTKVLETGVLFIDFLQHYFVGSILVMLMLIREISISLARILSLKFNPSITLVTAFLLIILIGASILMLPRSTTHSISFIDALFTATSATCITGLTVLDIANDFTRFGQIVIIILAQIGALGIMTFASFFAMFFQSNSGSFGNHIAMKEMLSVEKLSEIFSTIYKIIFITFIVEAIGIINLYFALNGLSGITEDERIFLAIFHGISAFCHAGFSNLPDGLMNAQVNDSFYFLGTTMALVVIGSLGFPIIFAYYKLLKRNFIGRLKQIFLKQRFVYQNRLVNTTTLIVVFSTISLLIFGFAIVSALEWNNLLADKTNGQKFIHGIFSSVTSRSSGFNTVDFSQFKTSTILIIILLMWIGAAPVSTGGGIKVTTFAVAFLNLASLIKGKEKVELRRRRIGDDSIRKAFSVIFISFISIGTGIFLLMLFQPDLPILKVVFECFSAYTTTGLSLGITPELRSSSKVVLIVLMFFGRLGILTILSLMVRKVQTNNYEYPREEIIIT